ncbi:MAG: hypothetical protein OEZ06_12535 [Myxococcales bacterium]|nr:hypothetical protein [Myxococcales bacterium]
MADEGLSGTLADEQAAMQKGKGGQLLMLTAFALALLGGLFFLMGGDDENRVYGELGKKINGLKMEHFDQFWGCALAGEDLRDVKSNADLSAQLDSRGRERGQAYGVHLRDTCLKKLEDFGPNLEALIAPEDLKEPIAAMVEANGKLRTAVSSLATYLDKDELEYDSDEASAPIKDATRAWYDFKKAHKGANDAIRTKKDAK